MDNTQPDPTQPTAAHQILKSTCIPRYVNLAAHSSLIRPHLQNPGSQIKPPIHGPTRQASSQNWSINPFPRYAPNSPFLPHHISSARSQQPTPPLLNPCCKGGTWRILSYSFHTSFLCRISRKGSVKLRAEENSKRSALGLVVMDIPSWLLRNLCRISLPGKKFIYQAAVGTDPEIPGRSNIGLLPVEISTVSTTTYCIFNCPTYSFCCL